jgi:hypothetical protein
MARYVLVVDVDGEPLVLPHSFPSRLAAERGKTRVVQAFRRSARAGVLPSMATPRVIRV